MKKKILVLCVATAVASSLSARHHYKQTKTTTRTRTHSGATRKLSPEMRAKYQQQAKLKAKRFVGKYLSMNEEQQKMVREKVKAFIKKHARGPQFLSNLKADLNKLVGNPSDTPISNFMKKVHELPTKEEKIAFLKNRWRKISRESKRRLVMKAARFVGFAEVVQREGLTGEFKDEIASIKERLAKLESQGPVPAESEKVTAKFKDQEGMPVAEEAKSEMLAIEYQPEEVESEMVATEQMGLPEIEEID